VRIEKAARNLGAESVLAQVIFLSVGNGDFRRAGEDFLEQWDILADELGLEQSSVGGDCQPLSGLSRPEPGRNQISQGLADSGPRFHRQVVWLVECVPDSRSHLFLSAPVLVSR